MQCPSTLSIHCHNAECHIFIFILSVIMSGAIQHSAFSGIMLVIQNSAFSGIMLKITFCRYAECHSRLSIEWRYAERYTSNRLAEYHLTLSI
jgi:hypothetical protein